MVDNRVINFINNYSLNRRTLDIFFEELQGLLCHSFIEIQQSTFQNELRLTLNTNEHIVAYNFAENIILFCQIKFSHFTGIMPKPQFTHARFISRI
jgi:hypothetical protein